MKKGMIIGIGNDSRQDDGLGWAMLDWIEERFPGSYQTEYAYQLNVEDAEMISAAEKVLFVDASSEEALDGACIEKCLPDGHITFSTHALNPEAIVALCSQVYEKEPDCYVLKLKGYEWALKTGLTKRGEESLGKGMEAFCNFQMEQAF